MIGALSQNQNTFLVPPAMSCEPIVIAHTSRLLLRHEHQLDCLTADAVARADRSLGSLPWNVEDKNEFLMTFVPERADGCP